MGIIELNKGDNRELQNIANILASSKRVVVVTGAGISTNCGIPVCYQYPSLWFHSRLNLQRISALKRVFTL